MSYIVMGNKTYRGHERQIENIVQRAATDRIINLSVKDVCDAAKISRQTFYLHYSNINDVQRIQEQRLKDDFRNRIGIITKREVIFMIMLNFIKDNPAYFSVALNRQDLKMLTWMVDYVSPRLVPSGVTGYAYYQYRGNIKSLMQSWLIQGKHAKQYFPFYIEELLRMRVMRSQLDDVLSTTKLTV